MIVKVSRHREFPWERPAPTDHDTEWEIPTQDIKVLPPVGERVTLRIYLGKRRRASLIRMTFAGIARERCCDDESHGYWELAVFHR